MTDDDDDDGPGDGGRSQECRDSVVTILSSCVLLIRKDAGCVRFAPRPSAWSRLTT